MRLPRWLELACTKRNIKMKGQVRGLALELLRQDCVESLEVLLIPDYNTLEAKQITEACRLYDVALHGAAKDDN